MLNRISLSETPLFKITYRRELTYRWWCPLKLMFSVPATRLATQTCLTSCGSALAALPSTIFSISLVKILPLASQAMHVGGVDDRTNTTGPVTSIAVSAVTQLLSSFVPVDSSATIGVFSVLGWGGASSAIGALRFFGLLSPLKASGLTIYTMFYAQVLLK